MTHNNLGIVLRDLGTRLGGEEGVRLLHEAVGALTLALEVRTFEHLPMQWAQTQNNLAETYVYLQDWPNVAASYANVLKVYPDYEKAYQTASYLYHEVLHTYPADYAAAFTLNQNWLARHPDDLSTQCDFAEKHFTTGRFAECETRIAVLLANPEIAPPVKIALRAIEIANLLALNKAGQILEKLDLLQPAIASQPDTFKVGWTFNGTKHFISQHEPLAPYRAWLLQFFSALEGENREAILRDLQSVRADYQAVAGKKE
jgi:tetratricopeptide (TPR) repeat protein